MSTSDRSRPYVGRRLSRTAIALACVASLSLLAAGCASGSDSENAGGKEDVVVLAGPGGALGQGYRSQAERAGKQHGFRVQYVEGTTGDNLAKLQTQVRSQRVEFDLMIGNDRTTSMARTQNLAQPLDTASLPSLSQLDERWALPAEVVGDTPVAVRLLVLPEGLAYNTEVFSRNGWPAPTSWADIYDPRYAACVIPISPASGLSYIPILNKLNSGDYANITPTLDRFKAIASQVKTTVNASPDALELLQQGTGCLTASSQTRTLEQKAAGAPVAFVFPKEGSGFLTNTIILAKDAPHPKAAHLALDAIISAEGATAMIGINASPVTNKNVTIPSSGPSAGLPKVDQFDSLGFLEIPLSVYANLSEWERQWDTVFSQ